MYQGSPGGLKTSRSVRNKDDFLKASLDRIRVAAVSSQLEMTLGVGLPLNSRFQRKILGSRSVDIQVAVISSLRRQICAVWVGRLKRALQRVEGAAFGLSSASTDPRHDCRPQGRVRR